MRIWLLHYVEQIKGAQRLSYSVALEVDSHLHLGTLALTIKDRVDR